MATLDPTQDKVFIQTGGQKLEGWLSTSVVRGVELMPSHFTFNITERYPTSGSKAVVLPGNSCTVYLGNDLILTGYIDEYSPSYDGHTHNVRISGRSKTEDVVDSSYWPDTGTGQTQGKSWVISPQPLSQAVKQILELVPNVSLDYQGEEKQIPSPGYEIPPGTSIYSVIETLCRMCTKLLWDDEKGNLVISDVGTKQAGSPLVEGVNVLAAATRYNWVQRVSQVLVIAAGAITGTSLANSILAKSYVDQEVADTGRKRVHVTPLDVFPGVNNEFAQKIANWEQSRRIGRSLMVEAHVVGWRDGSGNLWQPNSLVNLSLPEQKIQMSLVIAECEWRRDYQGTVTRMTLMPPGALQPAPFQPIRFPPGTATTTPSSTSPPLNPPT